MARPALEVADILHAHGPAFRAAHAGHLSLAQLKVMSAIERCRSAALGGHVVRCEACERTEIAYNSCRNRHCPKCQGAAAKRWLAERETELLPVSYFHVVFSVPSEIADIAYQNKAVVYKALFKAAAQTLLTIGADPKHLGAQLGMIAVLHTWGSAMTHHPHLHCIVPGGGLSRDGQHWVSSKRPKFLVSVRVLSMLFRRLMLEQLATAHRAGQLQFFAALEPLRDTKAFDAALRALKKRKWYIDIRPPFAGPAAVLQYLSRYTHRVAIANSRLLAFDETQVTFHWKDYRAAEDNRYKTMSLRTPEFIRRFLIHVLPHGFHRIRHYGLFANGQRSANLTKARACLNVQFPSDTHDDEPGDEAPPALWLACRACGQTMRIIEIFQPAPRHRGGDPPWP